MELSTLNLVILGLATWRLSSLLANEDGPFDLFSHLRYWIGVRIDSLEQQYTSNLLAKGMACIWCNSIWVGSLLTAICLVWANAVWLLLPLMLSTTAVFLQKLLEYFETKWNFR